ncbi:hypothetical protein ED733_001590 [Metarhizium rileyi]|uniref:Uncharacterized protein n=1 Tax=Metarhizium rileyi (strain RCEF 4871) TaxID=1649241 RepID=A0A5C6G7C0_METRR|nr:hypothetical protein ED733_001590 [Metarhizium rileyi]
MEEGKATVGFTTEAGEHGHPDAPSFFIYSDDEEMQAPDTRSEPWPMEESDVESDHDKQAEIPSSIGCAGGQVDDENTAPETPISEPRDFEPPSDTVVRGFSIDTGFEMGEDDNEALRLSLGVSRQPGEAVNNSPTEIPSPTTPGTQIAQEVRKGDRYLASPIQLHPRHSQRCCNTSPIEASNGFSKTPKLPRKRAYQMLEQETASILDG